MRSTKRPRRTPRPLLVAGTGIAAVVFGSALACGSVVAGVPVGIRCDPEASCGPTGTPVQFLDGGDGGETGTQYCGVPDGGDPVPCYPDGGAIPEPDGGDGGA